MSKAGGDPLDKPQQGQEVPAPHVWDEKSIEILMAQFHFMLTREVKNMKLDIVENIGAMLARRSGLDRELHELRQRIDFIGKAMEALALRVDAFEKAVGIPPRKPSAGGPIGSRELIEPRPPAKAPPPAVKKRGRKKKSGTS
jgi:hypothetical protein